MIITISGKAGSGKSTIAKLISQKLGLKHYSIGDLMREMASEKRISLLELNKLAEKDKSIDLELDNKLKELGKSKNNFVVDGRLTAYFIPNADARIFLEADSKTRAERIHQNRRKDESHSNVEETLASIKKREESEKARYKKYYGVDYTDKKHYNFVIDTTNLSIGEVVQDIIRFIKKKS